jgi:arylsulfatase A-like enzyme
MLGGLFLLKPELSFAHLLFGARLSFVYGAVLGVTWLVVAAVDARTRGASAMLALGMACALGSPFALSFGDTLAHSDGLHAKGFDSALLRAVGIALGLALSAVTWAFSRFARPRLLDLAAATLLAAGLLASLSLRANTNGALALLASSASLILLASVLELALPPPHARRVALGSFTLVALTFGLSLALSELTDVGRRRSLTTGETPLARLASALLPAPSGLTHLDLQATLDASCSALRGAPPDPLPLTMDARRNVVLVSIDTLRGDYVRRAARGRALMPELRRFMAEAWSTTEAYTPYPATLMAMTSTFTGLLPSEVALSRTPPRTLFEDASTVLDEVIAVVPSGRYFKRPDVTRYLLRQAEVHRQRNAEAQVAFATRELRRLRKQHKRHLMWIHLFEPHEPYVKHPGLDFGDTPEERYMSEVAAADRALGRLLTVLRDEGWYDDSLIVVLADHGEALGEHGQMHHHYVLYPQLTQVPLALRVPGERPKQLEGPVHLTDVRESVQHFLGRAEAPASLGRSLLEQPQRPRPYVLSEEFQIPGQRLTRYAEHPARSLAELNERARHLERYGAYQSKLALVSEDMLLIARRQSGTYELYDLARDPTASHDIAELRPDVLSRLVPQISALYQAMSMRIRCRFEEAGAP